jgi:nucleotide-binding universal stress UspA family protein
MFSKILVALDGSDHAKKALETAVKLAGRCEAELILFHAMQLGNLSPGYAAMVSRGAREVYQSLAQEQADAILGDAEQAATAQGIEQVTRLAKEADSAAAAILAAAGSAGVELIVVGTRGLTGLREIAMGSVAHKVTSAATCPVLIVR